MMFNIVLSGGVVAVVLVATLLLTWPGVPWTPLTRGTPLLMVVAPFLVFPWTKTLWLASDILMRPVTGEEMEWYARNGENSYRSLRDRWRSRSERGAVAGPVPGQDLRSRWVFSSPPYPSTNRTVRRRNCSIRRWLPRRLLAR